MQLFGLTHITTILTFELFEGGFNSDNFLDLWKGIWSLLNKHGEIISFL